MASQGALTVNGERTLYRASSVYDLLVILEKDPNRDGIAVAVNGKMIPREDWKKTALHPGDELEVVHAVAGG